MTVLYSITNSAEFQGGSVTFADGNTYPFSSDHPKYDDIIAALLAGEDETTIFGLVSPFEAIFLNFAHITDRVSRKGMHLYFDGDLLGTSIAKVIIETMDDEGYEKGTVWRSYVAFLERLMTNPSQESRDHLYKYVESHGLTITDDGMLLIYKGVKDMGDGNGVFRSSHAGYGIVTTPDGTITEYENDHLPNAVGYVVSMPRTKVDVNRRQHCSNGLHAGTYEYAKDFAPVLLTVLVDPRDVVAVPEDYNNAKIRVSKYTVLEVNEGKQYTGVVNTAAQADDSDDDDAELSDDEIYARDKLAEFKSLIPTLVKSGEPLRRYRNKRVTAKGRPFFDRAVADLGLSY